MPFMLSAVGIALPSLGREFAASARQLGLVETTYVLSVAVFLLSMGRLADIHGRRRIFEYGIALFTLASGLLSLAWSIESVIAFRFLQGVGGAMVMSTALAILVSVFPPTERGKALGITVACVYAGISCGPFFGGTLISAFGWRSIFYVCVPLGAATLGISRARLRGEWREARGEPFDWQGSLIYAVALFLLIAGASRLEAGGWSWVLLLAGITGIYLFLNFEGGRTYPILNTGLLLGNRVFGLSNLAALFNYAATFGVTFFLSLYLQYVKGMSPREAGTILIVQPIAQALLSPACGRLADRFPAGLVATVGMALCAVGLAATASISAGTPVSLIVPMLVLLGTGFALFSSPNTSIIMGSVEPRYLGVASGLNSSMRTLGMTASMTITTLIFSIFMGAEAVTAATQEAFLRSMRTALLTFSLLCLAGIFCSFGRLQPAAATVSKADED